MCNFSQVSSVQNWLHYCGLKSSITSGDIAELLPAGIHWSPMAITFCVHQHAMFLFNTKLYIINNVKGVSTPENK